MSIQIKPFGFKSHEVEEDDIDRATAAAEVVLHAHGVTAKDAYKAYLTQWDEYDDETQMHGLARVWLDARDAATTAMTATWSNPVLIPCSMESSLV